MILQILLLISLAHAGNNSKKVYNTQGFGRPVMAKHVNIPRKPNFSPMYARGYKFKPQVKKGK